MKHLIIRNIGPLSNVDISLSRINLIIGPQSTGKSCILKVACFCAWLEERIEFTQNPEGEFTKKTVEDRLIDFYRLKDFVNGDSFIEYETDCLRFSYSFGNDHRIFEWKKNRWEYHRRKVAYIIAERNVVAVVPNWYEVSLGNDYLRTFLAEWQNARNFMKDFGTVDVLGQQISYQYDDVNKEDQIIMDNGQALSLRSVSSGLQSVVPLYIQLFYFAYGFFLKKNNGNIIDEMLRERVLIELNKEFATSTSKFGEGYAVKGKSKQIINQLTHYDSCDLFIEEPEENLFPQTQNELVKWFAELMNNGGNHSLFIATHSPYVMSAFNNLIQAGDVIEEFPEKKESVDQIIGYNLSLSYDDVAAFAIADGTVHSIKDEELRLISPSELDTASDKISEVFNQLIQL